jgi:GntR family transcriptional regulator
MMEQNNPDLRLYMTLAASLREEITSGQREPASKLPSIDELCHKHSISRQTCSKALRLLHKEGLIYRQQGLGWYVAVNQTTPEAGS